MTHMCGILGIAAVRGERPSLSDAAAVRMRDLMEHRGPDDAALWRHENLLLAHRRLAIIDPTPAGRQPMLWSSSGVACADAPARAGATPRLAMVYNGELYNDAEIRDELSRRGVRFRSSCDSETLLHAWAVWGTEALSRLRGMFAFGVYDLRLHTLTLVRDALGVKPLYFWLGPREIAFASEIRPLLAHPLAVCAPNPPVVSAYLSTIRTALGNDTLYQGVYTLRPGQILRCDLDARPGESPLIRVNDWWRGERVMSVDPDPSHTADLGHASRRVRDSVTGSIARQLRSDVPVCALLSGGLDSTIISAVAASSRCGLRTFAAGCPVPASCQRDPQDNDLAHAREVSRSLRTEHDEAHVSRELFLERWPWMIHRTGLPLSTPNEVAIHEVSRLLRESGCVVTLSGEGADELFAGYEIPMDQAWAYEDQWRRGGVRDVSPGLFQLGACAWVPLDFKHGVLSERAWRAADHDAALTAFYEREFGAAFEECGGDPLAAHLRLHRRVNLAGLLQRLDSATMLAGVEGRTPFADADVADLAESLPMTLKYAPPGDEPGHERGASGVGIARATTLAAGVRTKLVLRRAFADVVPAPVLARPKASFPLPFESWMQEQSSVLRTSAFAAEVFSEPAINAVSNHPQQLWNLAWPMINIALWGEAMGW